MFDTKEKLNRSPLTCSVEWEERAFYFFIHMNIDEDDTKC